MVSRVGAIKLISIARKGNGAETVTPPEEFRTAMRGYEKNEVDARTGQLQTEIESLRKALADARSQVITADRAKLQIAGELSEAKQQLKKASTDQVEVSGPPGSRIDHLLKIAESQARETLAQATADAETIRNKARADAASQRARMHTESSDVLNKARSEAEAITASAELRAEETVKAAESRATELKATTEREAAQLASTSQAQSTAAHETLKRETATILADAQKAAADLRAKSTTEADAIVAEARRKYDQAKKAASAVEVDMANKRQQAEKAEKERFTTASAENNKLIAEAQARAKKADDEARAAAQRAETTRVEAVEKADRIIADGRKRAQELIAESRVTAEATIEESAAEAKRNLSSAQSQVDLLTKQRRTITAQLEQLRSMFAAPGLFDDVDLTEDKSDQEAAAALPTERIALGAERGNLTTEDEVVEAQVVAGPRDGGERRGGSGRGGQPSAAGSPAGRPADDRKAGPGRQGTSTASAESGNV